MAKKGMASFFVIKVTIPAWWESVICCGPAQHLYLGRPQQVQ